MNEKINDAVNIFVTSIFNNDTKITKALIDSKLLYIFLSMPKAQRKDLKKLAPVIFEVDPNALKDALYKHYGL